MVTMVTECDTTSFRLRYKFTGYAYKLRSMATGYSQLEYDTIVGFHMSLKFKIKNYRSYPDFTFTMH